MRFNKINLAVLSVILLAIPWSAANAQRAVEQWHYGVRYLFVYNTESYPMRCGILDVNGSWFWADVLPGQYIYKAVHPSNSAQWNCNPIG